MPTFFGSYGKTPMRESVWGKAVSGVGALVSQKYGGTRFFIEK
jgi:hypothetical protein